MSKPKRIYDYFVLVHSPKHPRAVSEGYVPEHYLVAEKQLGRSLTPDEDVRHINGNAQDNRVDNLEIVSINSDYKSQSISDDPFSERKPQRNYTSCKFQRQCWKEIRAPIARKNKVFLPYVCSYQTEGDVFKCSHFFNYVDKEMEIQKEATKE